MIDYFLGDAFGVCPASFEYCSEVWRSAVYAHFKLHDRVVSGAHFLTEGVFECDTSHRRSMTVLCMQYRYRRNPMHPHYGALSVPMRVTRGAFVAHQYTCAPPHCKTSQEFYSPLSVSVERSC